MHQLRLLKRAAFCFDSQEWQSLYGMMRAILLFSVFSLFISPAYSEVPKAIEIQYRLDLGARSRWQKGVPRSTQIRFSDSNVEEVFWEKLNEWKISEFGLWYEEDKRFSIMIEDQGIPFLRRYQKTNLTPDQLDILSEDEKSNYVVEKISNPRLFPPRIWFDLSPNATYAVYRKIEPDIQKTDRGFVLFDSETHKPTDIYQVRVDDEFEIDDFERWYSGAYRSVWDHCRYIKIHYSW